MRDICRNIAHVSSLYWGRGSDPSLGRGALNEYRQLIICTARLLAILFLNLLCGEGKQSGQVAYFANAPSCFESAALVAAAFGFQKSHALITCVSIVLTVDSASASERKVTSPSREASACVRAFTSV